VDEIDVAILQKTAQAGAWAVLALLSGETLKRKEAQLEVETR
jgi:hypothetical protein